MTQSHRTAAVKAPGRDASSPSPSGLRHWWPVLLIVVLVGLYGGVAGLAWWLEGLAHEHGARAQQEFPGDEVEALVALASSEHHSLTERNEAIHALAKLADRRALPVLVRMQTGKPCDHDHDVCQHELQKAIERCRGERRPPAWLSHLPFFPDAASQAERR